MAMASNKAKITKRIVDQSEPGAARYYVWDSELKGFGLLVSSKRAEEGPAAVATKTYILRYRLPGAGRTGGKGFLKLGRHGQVTADEAREQAKIALGEIASGRDPARERAEAREAEVTKQANQITVEELGKQFLAEAIEGRRKAATGALYEGLLRLHFNPHFGKRVAAELTRADITALHAKMKKQQPTANRVLTAVSSMYSFAAKRGIVPEGFNPTRGIEKYREVGCERYLTTEELKRLGMALHDAETVGIPWVLNETNPKFKHTPKTYKGQREMADPFAVAALRLLIFTGARLREILHLKWEHVHLDRGLLLLPDSKTGKKTIVLNSAAEAVIRSLLPNGGTVKRAAFVIESDFDGKPRADLKRPWASIKRHAQLEDLRIHDLRHTFASIGAGASLGLPIVGKLLGHSQPQTTARYAHLDADPLRRAANVIGNQLSAALAGAPASQAAATPPPATTHPSVAPMQQGMASDYEP